MGRFARPAPWLDDLFIPSRSQPEHPSLVSDDVSLIQPYDGSGWPIPPIGEWVISTTGPAATNGNQTLYTLGDDQVARILALHFTLTAGAAVTAFYYITAPSTLATACSPQTAVVPGGEMTANKPYSVIVPPGHSLSGRYFGGDAASVVEFAALSCRVPLGTVFYV